MHRRAILVAALLFVVASGHAGDSLRQERYVFSKSGLSIPKQLDTLVFVDEFEHRPNGVDMQVRYSDPDKGLNISLYVYESPPHTEGPTLMLNQEGKEILEDREDVIKRYNAVFKLNPPSASYEEEYKRTIQSVSEQGFKLKTECRIMAAPALKGSPIAYSAHFVNTRNVDGKEIRFLWRTYLYSIPGYFIKIHCTFPEPLWLELAAVDVKFIQAINWSELLHLAKPTKN